MNEQPLFPEDDHNPFDDFTPSEENQDMLEGHLEQLETDGELLAKAIGSYYRELVSQELPDEIIAHLVINYQHNWLQ